VVQAHFVKVKGSSVVVRKAQGIFLNTGVVSDVESDDIEVSVGSHIQIGNPPHLMTYVVDSIDGNGVVCCMDATVDTEEPIHMSMKEAN
jgi:hypothetical protein